MKSAKRPEATHRSVEDVFNLWGVKSVWVQMLDPYLVTVEHQCGSYVFAGRSVRDALDVAYREINALRMEGCPFSTSALLQAENMVHPFLRPLLKEARKRLEQAPARGGSKRPKLCECGREWNDCAARDGEEAHGDRR